MVKALDKDKVKEKAYKNAVSKNWYKDHYERVVIHRNWLIIITSISLIALAFSVITLVGVTNSKTFEPFLIQVDKKTNVLTNVTTKSVREYSADESIRRSLLARYVMAREGYQSRNYQYFYDTITRLFSTSNAYRKFRYELVYDENSPIKLGESVEREVKIKSITFLEPKKAQVRFKTIDKDIYGERIIATKHYISTINFDFFNKAKFSINERYFNPLNFQVISYNKENEIID